PPRAVPTRSSPGCSSLSSRPRHSASEQVGWIHPPSPQQRAQLPQSRAFDLADALSREAELAADGLESLRLALREPEAPAQHLTLVLGEVVEDGREIGPLAEQ